MKKFIRYFYLISLRKFRNDKRYYALLLWILWIDIRWKKQWLGMFIQSRIVIIYIKLFPPTYDLSWKLSTDPKFEYTTSSENREIYRNKIYAERNRLHNLEMEKDFSPEFRKHLTFLRSKKSQHARA